MKGLITLALTLVATVTLAGSTVTPKPSDSVLHNADNTTPAGYTATSSRFKTPELCNAAAADGIKTGALKPTVKCDTSVSFAVAQDCEGEKPPKLYLSKERSAEDGKDYWVLPGASFADDGTWTEVANLYVHVATWPAGFPNCWVRGEAPRNEWRLNSKAEPGKAFMELRDASMPPGDLVAEEPNDETPAGTPEGFDAEYHTLAAEEVRHSTCVCYPDDQTACPAKCPGGAG